MWVLIPSLECAIWLVCFENQYYASIGVSPGDGIALPGFSYKVRGDWECVARGGRVCPAKR